jgi:regulatory protein
VPIDAEGWLASRGVRREPLIVGASAPPSPQPPAAAPAPTAREVVRLAEQSARDAALVAAPTATPDLDDEGYAPRSDDADSALAFVRRSTSNAPQSEGRLRAKLVDRGYDGPTVELALERARAERLVDDDAILAALIVERRARGHADARLRRDLRDRGFTGAQVDEALALHAATDPAAAAFAVAREQAARHRSVDAEVAVRRTVGALLRRGHGEALARKAARDAVYADREAEQVAGR